MFRSAGEIGVDVFFRERHQPVLLSEEIVEPSVHRYVQYTQGGRGVEEEYVQRRESETRRTLMKWFTSRDHGKSQSRYYLWWKNLLNNCLPQLGKFNMPIDSGGGLRKDE